MADEFRADADGADGNADLQREGEQRGHQQQEGEDEEDRHQLIGVQRADGGDEQDGDERADGERGGDGEADGAVGEQHAAIQHRELVGDEGAFLIIAGFDRFQLPGAIDDAAEARGDGGQEGADRGEQENGRDRELDRLRQDRDVGIVQREHRAMAGGLPQPSQGRGGRLQGAQLMQSVAVGSAFSRAGAISASQFAQVP